MFKKEMITTDTSAELVSIIIVAHNKKKLPACLTRIYNQDYPNIELILVDKGGFIAENRNYGFERCSGKYVLFLDDDEYLTPGAISACVKKFQEGYDMVGLEVTETRQHGYVSQAIALTRQHGPKSLFFRKSVLDGLDCLFKIEYVYCDDVELQVRTRSNDCKVGKVGGNEARMIHSPTLTLLGILRKVLLGRKLYRHMVNQGEINRPVQSNRRRILRLCTHNIVFTPFLLFFMTTCFIARRIP